MGEFSLSDNQALMKKQIENTVRIINSFFDNQELSYTALQNALFIGSSSIRKCKTQR